MHGSRVRSMLALLGFEVLVKMGSGIAVDCACTLARALLYIACAPRAHASASILLQQRGLAIPQSLACPILLQTYKKTWSWRRTKPRNSRSPAAQMMMRACEMPREARMSRVDEAVS